MASAGQASTGTVVFSALALNSRATTTSTGRWIVQPADCALSMIARAVSAMSRSARLVPTSIPLATRKVLAIPPPMIR